MAEVLVSGPPDRPPRRWLRGLVVGALAVAVTGLAGPRLLGALTPEPAPVPTAGPTSAAPPDAPTAPATSSPWDPAQPRLDGVPGTVPAGIMLAVGGPAPTVLGRGSGPAFALDQLPTAPGESVVSVLPTSDGLVAVVLRATFEPGRPAARAFAIGRTGGWRPLTDTDEAIVGRRADRVFALRYPAAERGRGTLLELSLTGRVLARHRTPSDFAVHADTGAGLLVSVGEPAGSRRLQVVDPRTLAVRSRLASVGWVNGASADRVVWSSPGCTASCVLTVADLATGVRRTVPAAAGFAPGPAVLSPDGRRLAVGYWGRHPQQAGGSAPGFVDVIDLTSGGTTRVPGVASATKSTPDLAWTPDGTVLAVAVNFQQADVRRAGLWPVTGGPVRLLSTELPGAQPAALTVLPAAS